YSSSKVKVSPCRCLGLILREEREVQFTCGLDAQLYSDLIMSPPVRIVSAICRPVLATSASLPHNCLQSAMSGKSPLHGSALNVRMLTATPSSVRCGGSQGGWSLFARSFTVCDETPDLS